MRKRLDEFEIRPDATTVSMATVGKRRHHVFSNVFDRLRFILAGNDDIRGPFGKFVAWHHNSIMG